METQRVAGPMLRLLRLQKNWSQETLCRGICAVSYLSKIEQGKVEPNGELLDALFGRLGEKWEDTPDWKELRDDLFEAVFSWDNKQAERKMKLLEDRWDRMPIGPCYGDFLVLRAFYRRKPEWVPKELEPLPDVRQQALIALMHDRHEDAHRLYPCPLTAICMGEDAFRKGNYTLSLEYFQMAYDQAAREGYAYIMLYAQHFMAASYSDMGNLDAMYRHSRIAERLGRALGEDEVVRAIHYNIAATKVEYGDYESAYSYFSQLADPDAMALHKLAVCCEALGRHEEGIAALDRAEALERKAVLGKEMCDLIRYRLEHRDYLHDPRYGELLLNTYQRIQTELPAGFARFHLRWVTEWLTANRQYRKAYEVLQDFPHNRSLSGF